MTYVVKSKPGCPFCVKAMDLLAGCGEQVIEQKHETLLEVTAFKQAGFKTFPQVFHNGKHIGGFAELWAYYNSLNQF